MPPVRRPRPFVVTLSKEGWVDRSYEMVALDELEALALARARVRADPDLSGCQDYACKVVEVRSGFRQLRGRGLPRAG